MQSQLSQQFRGIGAIVAFLGLTWLATQASDGGIEVLARSGYWIMLMLLAAWLVTAHATLPVPGWKEVRLPFALAAVGTVIAFASSPIGFKVLSDETNLLSVSQSMYQNKTALHPTMGKYYYDNFHATFVTPPSRPLVFPFLLSLVHSLTGYQTGNPFVLNAVALFALLLLVGTTTQRALGPWDAIAATLLVLSHPIVLITATSGGFDVISVLAMLGVLLAARRHMQIRTRDSLAFVWMTLLVYAQIRYESIVAVPLVMAFLLVRGYITTDMIYSRFAYFAAGPLFLFPWLLQRQLHRNSFENPPGVPAFSGPHFFQHLDELIRVNFDFQFYYPYDNLLNIAGVLLLPTLLFAAARRRFTDWSREQCDFLGLAAFVVGAGLVVFLSHHMGKAGHPTQARFFIPLSLALASVPLLVRRHQPEWLSSQALLSCAAALFVVYQPVAGESRIMHSLILTRESRLAMNYLATFGHHRILTISDRSGQYAALNYGAVDFPAGRRDVSALLIEHRQRLFDEIVVFQEVDFATNEPIGEHALPPLYHLQTTAEFQISGERKLRISRSVPADD